MTTIITIKNESTGSILIASDSQVTSGNLKMPLIYNKIIPCGNRLLFASSGNVSESQYLSRSILKQCRIKRLIADELEFNDISLDEFSQELQDILYESSRLLAIREYNSEFLLLGKARDEELKIFSVGSDGSLITIPSFYSIGSGSQVAIGQLQNLYYDNQNRKYKDDEFAGLLMGIIGSVSSLDIYTNPYHIVFGINKEGELIKFDIQLKGAADEKKKRGSER